MRRIEIFDATLREGAQGMGISFSVGDKLRVVRLLDSLGVSYIEAGNPGSNPKDAEFFARVEKPAHARLVAFGATARVGAKPEEDAGLKALIAAGTPAVSIVGKAWSFHVGHVLGTTNEENLRMISETIRYLKSLGKEVLFDAEHFFDGFRNDEPYAWAALRAAEEAGADWLVLCDTNGGCFPDEIGRIVGAVTERMKAPVAIHAHNDTGMAEANAIAGVDAGAGMVQCTLGGWGERCGNTDLFTVIPNLQLKRGYDCIPDEKLRGFYRAAAEYSEFSNTRPSPRAPYIGKAAFSHKAGMHIDGVWKSPESFEHIDPELVGATRRFALSEVAGRAAVYSRVRAFEPELATDSPFIARIVGEIKNLEYEGYQFEGADASFALLCKRVMGKYRPHFELKGFNVTITEPADDAAVASAVVRISVDGAEEVAGAVGNGPVNALDRAARRALGRFYPALAKVQLSDYRVRVLDSAHATASKVRAIIESSDGQSHWSTVGVSADIVKASWTALVDALEYKLMKDEGAVQ